jgi:bifunctional non-homologous end joining protein LigD
VSAGLEVGGREVEISRPDKVLFPGEGLTKLDLAEYYAGVGEVAIPHLLDRAVTMHRFPDGIEEEGFYQKEAPDYFPDWIRRERLSKEDGEVEHVVCEEPACLVYLANQGCITPHISLSRADAPEYPDRLVFDLDPPGDDPDVGRLHDSAREVRALLADLDLDSFLMTTGSRGYHIVVPLDRSADFDAARDFARRLAEELATRHPERLTAEQRKAKRGNRVFVDYLRNSYAQTTVTPYAVRALPGAPVATPLDWDELGGSEPRSYTTRNLLRRLGQKSDPWKGLVGHPGHDLAGAGERLEEASSG